MCTVSSTVSSHELRETLQTIKESLQPTVVLVSNQLLGEHAGADLHKLLASPNTLDATAGPTLKVLKSSAFDMNIDLVLATLRVKQLTNGAINLDVNDDGDMVLSRSEVYTLLSSAISFDQVPHLAYFVRGALT